MPSRGGRRPPSLPTRAVAPAQAGNYLRKAEDHLAAATEAATTERWSTVVLLSVHAAISASDAARVATAGLRSISQTHMDQVRLIRQLFSADADSKKASDHLAALLDLKNTAEYEAKLFQRVDATTALKHAERLVNWARAVCHK